MPFQRDIIVIASVLAIIPILSTRAYSDELGDHCDAILQSAATNVDIDMLSNEYLNALYDKTCTSTGSARSDSGSIGFGDFKLGYGTSGTSASNFCAKHKNTRFEHTTSNSYKQNVSGKALDTYLECRKAAQYGISVEHRFVNVDKMNFSIGAPRSGPVEFRGFDASANVHCQLTVKKGDDLVGDLIELTRAITASTRDTFAIFCTRDAEPELGPQGQKVYSEAAIEMGFSGATNYSVLWPKDEVLPQTLASQIELSLQTLRQRVPYIDCAMQQATATAHYPQVTASIPVPLRGIYKLTGGGCMINSYDSKPPTPATPHNGTIVESHPTEDQTGWQCHAGDPPMIPLTLRLTSFVTYCRANNP